MGPVQQYMHLFFKIIDNMHTKDKYTILNAHKSHRNIFSKKKFFSASGNHLEIRKEFSMNLMWWKYVVKKKEHQHLPVQFWNEWNPTIYIGIWEILFFFEKSIFLILKYTQSHTNTAPTNGSVYQYQPLKIFLLLYLQVEKKNGPNFQKIYHKCLIY